MALMWATCGASAVCQPDAGFRGQIDPRGLRRVVEAQQWVVRVGDGLLAEFAVVQLELDVALAAGEPDFADHHVVEHELVGRRIARAMRVVRLPAARAM
jgi:hypothetical protein